MSNLNLYVPDEIYRKMKQHTEIKWNKIVRKAIENKLKEIVDADLRNYALKRLVEQEEDAQDLFLF